MNRVAKDGERGQETFVKEQLHWYEMEANSFTYQGLISLQQLN